MHRLTPRTAAEAVKVLEKELPMTIKYYSDLIACLYDQPSAAGRIGRGTHYSVFRRTQWQTRSGGAPINSARIHDFAVIWDEDHDERVIPVIERLHLAGLLWPVIFIGERKGGLTLLLDHMTAMTSLPRGYSEAVASTVQNAQDDVWHVEFGTYHRDPGNKSGLTDPSGIISDDHSRVIAYLQAIDVLWRLSEETSHPSQG